MDDKFRGPAKYAVYGGTKGQTARITGCKDLVACDEVISLHQRQHPGCSYSVWKADWTQVKEVKAP